MVCMDAYRSLLGSLHMEHWQSGHPWQKIENRSLLARLRQAIEHAVGVPCSPAAGLLGLHQRDEGGGACGGAARAVQVGAGA